MNQTQKIIKYIAMAFGIFLAVNIISAIVVGIAAISGLGFGIGLLTENGGSTELIEFSETFERVENIDIEVAISKFNIKIGDELKVEASNVTDQFYVKIESDTLVIKDERKSFFGISDNKISQITLYIPEDLAFEKTEIETGVGECNIEYLHTAKLTLKQGVGNLFIESIIANDSAKIDGGVGKLEIRDAKVNDLDLNGGVGEFSVIGEITGNSKVECGIGKVYIKVKGNKENYKVSCETGIGNITIDNVKVSNNTVYGSGKYTLDIDGGIGKAEVYFTGEDL